MAKGVEAYKNYTGRFAEMLAFSALLVQYSTERELARLCATGQRPLDVAGCRLGALGDSASADYDMLVPLGTSVVLMIAVDTGLVFVRAHLNARAFTMLVVLYALLSALPCVGFFAVVFVVPQHTEPLFLAYLLVVGGLLVLARTQRVLYAVLKHGRDAGLRPLPLLEETADSVVSVSSSRERVRIEGTAQKRAHKSKRQ